MITVNGVLSMAKSTRELDADNFEAAAARLGLVAAYRDTRPGYPMPVAAVTATQGSGLF